MSTKNINKQFLNKETLEDPRKFIALWITVHAVEFDKNHGAKFHGLILKNSQIFEKIFLDANKFVKAFNSNSKRTISMPKKDLFEMAFREHLESVLRKLVETHIEKVKYDQMANTNELVRFVKALVGSEDLLVKRVIQHTVWQVKRKMLALPVKDHLMIIIIGPQGRGKSVAVSKFVSPLEPFVTSAGIDQMTDPRSFSLFEDNFIVINDEMQGHNKVDVDKLKNIITATSLRARRLGTHCIDTFKQNCTFIGTSNKMLFEIINDDTGLRRFFGINTLDKINWDEVNAIDYLKIWQSVNENQKSGYLEDVADQIRTIQEENTPKSSIKLFCEHYQLVGSNMSHSVCKTQLYELYSAYCSKFNYKPFAENNFGKRIRQEGVGSARIRNSLGKKDTIYIIDADSPVLTQEFAQVDRLDKQNVHLLKNKNIGEV